MVQRLRKRAAVLNDRACVCYIASGLLVMMAFITYFIPIGKTSTVAFIIAVLLFMRGKSYDRIAKDILFDLEL